MSTQTLVTLKLGDPLPMSIGECADAYGEIRALRLELEAKAEEIKKRENETQEHLRALMIQQNAEVGGGHVWKVKRTPKVTAIIDDWAAFCAYVARTGKTELLYKRVNDKAAHEIFEAEGTLPDGISEVVAEKITPSKV